MLPDLLAPGLTVVFAGTSVSTLSAERGHYYSNPRNDFWKLLAATGLLGRERLGPEDDARVVEYGVGLTDVVKGRAESSDARLRSDDFGPDAFVEKILGCQPAVVAFNGSKAGAVAARHLREATMTADGPGAWMIGGSRVYRVPSSSRAAATIGWESKLAAWVALGDWVRAL